MFGGFDLSRGTSSTDKIWKKTVLLMKDREWKDTRSIMSPIFSTGKIKVMTQFMNSISDEMLNHARAEMSRAGRVDLSDVSGKFSMETIASCAFGVRAGSFSETGERSRFLTVAFNFFSLTLWNNLMSVAYLTPGIKHLIDLLGIPVNNYSDTKWLAETVRATIRHREETKTRRNDLIDLMMDAVKAAGSGDKNSKTETAMDESIVMANCMLILSAGYDSTGGTLAHALFHVTVNPEIQERLRQEIDDAFDSRGIGGDVLDYTTLNELEYLDQIVMETLRMYPAFNVHARECTQDYQMPGTDLVIRKGDEVIIPVMGFQYDQKLFPNPEQFNPERFTKEAAKERHSMAFMTFGLGPRNCMGLRFAMLDIKIAMVKMMRNFHLVPTADTPKNKRLAMAPGAVGARAAETLWVKMESIDRD